MSEEQFLRACGIELSDLQESGWNIEDLRAVLEDHLDRRAILESAGRSVVDLIRSIDEVHSVRFRVKNAYHLCEKIVRKANAGRVLTLENYRTEISDLVGIRALHLLKEEWRAIHDFVTTTWAVEKPTAFIRDGDSDDWRAILEEAGCNVEEHPRQYRSVHYDLRVVPTKDVVPVELQVRTIFEEAWAEIDHRINYPILTPSQPVSVCLSIFNRLAGQADEMASFVSALEQELRGFETEMADVTTERDEALKEVNDLIERLEVEKGAKVELREKLMSLRKAEEDLNSLEVSSRTIGKGYVPLTSYDSFVTTSAFANRCRDCGRDMGSAFTIDNRCSECSLMGAFVTRRCRKCNSPLSSFGMMISVAGKDPHVCDACRFLPG